MLQAILAVNPGVVLFRASGLSKQYPRSGTIYSGALTTFVYGLNAGAGPSTRRVVSNPPLPVES